MISRFVAVGTAAAKPAGLQAVAVEPMFGPDCALMPGLR